MDNLRIAKQLVRLAKGILADGNGIAGEAESNVKEVADVLYRSLTDDGCWEGDWHVRLPGGWWLATDGLMDDTEGSRGFYWYLCEKTDMMGVAYGKIFKDYGDLVCEGDTYEDCMKAARLVIEDERDVKMSDFWTEDEFYNDFVKNDNDFQELTDNKQDFIRSHMKLVMDEIDKGSSVYTAIEDVLDENRSRGWHPAPSLGLNEIEKSVFENACDCLYYGYGFGHLNYDGLDEKRAREIWKMAFDAMAEDDD